MTFHFKMSSKSPLSLIILITILLHTYCKDDTNTPQNSITITKNEQFNFFTIPVIIGTPIQGQNAQTFNLQVDTTTSETWVPSTKALTVNDYPRFNATASSSVKETLKEIEVDDEDGDVEGVASYDNIKIGNFELRDFGFVEVTKYDDDGFRDYPGGKLGWGYKQDHGDDFNLMKVLKQQGLISREIFTIVPHTKELILGGVPPEYENADTTSVCNITETHDLDDEYRAGWVCEISHVFFHDNTTFLDNAEEWESRVVFDSAYQYISIPIKHIKKFRTEFIIPNFNTSCDEVSVKIEEDDDNDDDDNDDDDNDNDEKEIFFVCNTDSSAISQLQLTFVLQGFGYVMQGKDLFKTYNNNQGKMELLIRFTEENDNIWSFGVPFVNLFTISYNAEDKQVGFYSDEIINFEEDWDLWLHGLLPSQQKRRMKILIICASVIGGILLIAVALLIIRECRRKTSVDIETKILIHNEEKK